MYAYELHKIARSRTPPQGRAGARRPAGPPGPPRRAPVRAPGGRRGGEYVPESVRPRRVTTRAMSADSLPDRHRVGPLCDARRRGDQVRQSGVRRPRRRTGRAHRRARPRRRGPGAAGAALGGEAGVGKTRLIEEFAHARPAAAGAVVAVGGCVEIGADGLPFAPFSTALRALRRTAARRTGRRRRRTGGRTGPAPARTGRQPTGTAARRAGHRPPLRAHRPAAGAHRRRPHRRPRPGGPALGRRLHPPPPRLSLPHAAQRPPRRRRHLPRRRHPPPPPPAPAPRRTGPAAHRPPHRTRPLQPRRGRPPARRHPRRRARTRPWSTRSSNAPTATPSSSRNSPCASGERLPHRPHRLPARPAPRPRRSAPRGRPAGRPDRRRGRLHRRVRAAAPPSPASPRTTSSRRCAPPSAPTSCSPPPTGDGYRFRHSLVREAVSDDLLPGERSRLNRRYAEALEADPSLVRADERVTRLASYWYHAHDAAKALPAVLDASVEARRRHAYSEQLRLLERAMELWDDAPDEVRADTAPRRLRRGLPALRLRPGHHPAALPRPDGRGHRRRPASAASANAP